MHKIVVGYDGNDTADRAVEEAAELAQKTGAELHIVTIVDEDRARQGVVTPGTHDSLKQRASAQIDQLLAPDQHGLGERFGDVRTFTKVMSGAPADQILNYADAIEADLIVVGNRRVQGLDRLLGSVAMNVLRNSPRSVYVAHTT